MPLSPDEMNYALMMGRTVSDSGEASSPIADALKAMGLDSSIHNRPTLLPVQDRRPDGTSDWSKWTAPKWLPGALGMAVTPGIAMQGTPITPEEGVDFATGVATAAMGAGSAAKAPSGSLGMFVGEKARGVNLDKLAEAKLLIAAKQSPEFVWKDTGWMQGKGGHWMTEIPDREMAWLPQSDSATTVQEAIRHHPLFTAYPQLKGVGFKFDKLGGNTAGRVDENGIKLSDELINGGRYQRSAYQTMIHELQHQVQQIEGWPTGGNVRSVDARPHLYDPASANAYEELAAAQSNPAVAIPEYVALEQKFNAAKDTYRNSKPAIERYRNLAGEAQARQSAARYWLTEQERLERYPGRSDVHLSETGIAPSDVVNNPHVPFAGGGVVKALDKLLSYYHGSDVKGISVLDPLYGLGRRTEGKAVWVKPSPEEAAGYVKKGSGSVYRVDVDPTDFAHLDANFTSNKAIHPEAMIVHHNGETTPISSLGNKVTTDDVAAHARSMGDKGIHIHNVADMGSGPYGALADGPHGQSTAIFAPVKTIEERPAKLIAQDPTPFAEGGRANVPNPSPEADAMSQRVQDPTAAKLLNLDLMTLHMAGGGLAEKLAKALGRALMPETSASKRAAIGIRAPAVDLNPAQSMPLATVATPAPTDNPSAIENAISAIVNRPMDRRDFMQQTAAQAATRMMPNVLGKMAIDAVTPVDEIARQVAKVPDVSTLMPGYIGKYIEEGVPYDQIHARLAKDIPGFGPQHNDAASNIHEGLSEFINTYHSPEDIAERGPDYTTRLEALHGLLAREYGGMSPMSLRPMLRNFKSTSPGMYEDATIAAGSLEDLQREALVDRAHTGKPYSARTINAGRAEANLPPLTAEQIDRLGGVTRQSEQVPLIKKAQGGQVQHFAGGTIAKKLAKALMPSFESIETNLGRRKLMGIQNEIPLETNALVPVSPATPTNNPSAIENAISAIVNRPMDRRDFMQQTAAQLATRAMPNVLGKMAIDAVTPVDEIARQVAKVPDVKSQIPGFLAKYIKAKIPEEDIHAMLARDIPGFGKEHHDFASNLDENLRHMLPDYGTDIYGGVDEPAFTTPLEALQDLMNGREFLTENYMGIRPVLRGIREQNPKMYEKMLQESRNLADTQAGNLWEYTQQNQQFPIDLLNGDRAAMGRPRITSKQLQPFIDEGLDDSLMDFTGAGYAQGGQVQHFAEGDSVQASPRNLFQDIVGTAGGWLANAGEQTSNAMDTIRDTHPARSALVDLLLADQLKNAGTALQDWTGTQRSIDAPDIQYTPSPIHGGSTLQTFKFDPRALDVAATVQPLASVAMKGARAAVPFAKNVAEMGFELAMQGKIPGMPAMASYVVPPQGNLNLTPVVNAQLLKGPEKQTVESFSKQLIGTPGVTGKGITEATSHLDPKSVGSKTDFADALAPSKYEKIDLHGTVVDPTLIDTAHELVEPEGLIQSLNVPERYVDNFQQFMDGEVALNELPRPLQQRLRKTGMDTPTAAGDAYRELYEEAMFQKVRELTEEAEPITHADTQRLAGHELESADNTAGYFEIGVTHPSFNAHPGKHFENAPKSLVGHVRGTFLDDFMESYPGAENDILYLPKPLPNSAMIEEIQSDVAKAHGKHPALHQISATLFKAAVQHALENGVDHVYVPTAHTIGVARESSALKYEPIYDNEVLKDGISPLMRVPGVTVQTALVPGESDKIAYHVISFSPEAKAHLKEIGQATPGYKKGGAVHFVEGGDVDAMQAEIKAYDPTWRETMAQYLQQGAESLGISRPIARRATQSITGGPESALPIQMGIADIVPFLGTALQTQEAVRGGKRAVDAAQRGDFGEAAIEGGAAALGMIPGAVGTKRVIDKVAPFANRVGDMLAELAAKGYIPGAPSYGSHVIKTTGGNWLPGSVEKNTNVLKGYDEIEPLQTPIRSAGQVMTHINQADGVLMTAEEAAQYAPQMAVDKWIDRRLVPYIKNDMGTPGDPVRALAEKGTLHFEPKTHATGSLSDDWVKGSRAGEGFPPEGLGQSQLAKDWEYYTDSSIVPYTASVKQENARLVEQHPWIAKLEPESRINQPLSYWDNSKFGFNHLTDELQNALNPTSGLPQNLLIEPDKLGKMTMPDVVQHVAKINEWRAQNAGKVALQLTEGMPVHKEYPGQGFKWVELTAPKDAKSVDDGFGNMSTPGYSELEKALKYEGDTMGHCVGAYCDDVASGQTRIYSLRDKNNEPHVTIEVSPNPYAPRWDAVKPYLPQAEELLRSKGITNADEEEISQLATQLAKENAPPHIVQIKGKGNAAPNDKYLPFVQDFVKSGNWGEVGDLENSGLRHRANVFNDAEQARIAAAGHALPEYMTPDEIKAINQKVWPDAGPAPTEPSGMKKGGKVKFANNINDMRAALALGN